MVALASTPNVISGCYFTSADLTRKVQLSKHYGGLKKQEMYYSSAKEFQ